MEILSKFRRFATRKDLVFEAKLWAYNNKNKPLIAFANYP